MMSASCKNGSPNQKRYYHFFAGVLMDAALRFPPDILVAFPLFKQNDSCTAQNLLNKTGKENKTNVCIHNATCSRKRMFDLSAGFL
jgi:hypothetical protein